MNVQTQDVVERLKEILRAKVNDPFNRGNDATETIPTGNTTITLSNKELKNINSATGATTGNEYYRFKDFSVTFDNPSNTNDYPEITFETGTSEDVSIDYHYGKTWIYPTFPNTTVDNAVISIQNIAFGTERKYLGQDYDSNTKSLVNSSSWQIDIWVGNNAAVDDPDNNHPGHFSGGKLADYLSDQVKSALIENMDHLEKQGIIDVECTLEQGRGWSEDVQQHRKMLNFEFMHFHEW